MEVVYAPVIFYYAWLALKARSLWFFSAANPSIETGGMLGEAKYPLIRMIPEEYRPKSFLIRPGTALPEICTLLAANNIVYPVIAKPDVGERGFLVAKIADDAAMQRYIDVNKVDYIIQEYVDLPLEMGILYYRFPHEESGHIASVVIKEFLTVKGDGKSTLRELIGRSPRAILQWEKFRKRFGARLDEILPEGELLELEAIGNHAQGTKFLNGNHLADERMIRVCDEITRGMPDVYYCRYDLRTSNVEDLKQGKNIRILEVNGVGADPAHIYDPDYSIFKAWGDFFRLWKVIYTIAKANHKRGVPYMTTRETRERWKKIKAYRKFAV